MDTTNTHSKFNEIHVLKNKQEIDREVETRISSSGLLVFTRARIPVHILVPHLHTPYHLDKHTQAMSLKESRSDIWEDSEVGEGRRNYLITISKIKENYDTIRP